MNSITRIILVSRSLPAAFALAALLALSAPFDTPAAAGKKSGADEIKKKIQGLPPAEQVALLEDLVEKTPGDAHLRFYLGNAYLSLELADSAAAEYEQAVALDSTYTRAYVNLGIALEDLRRFDEARDRYEKALGIDSTDVLAHCHLGHYLHTRGDLEQAVSHYTRAIEIDPKSAQAHYNLGLAFADTRLFAEAMREWETVIELSPKSELGRTAAENLQLIKTYVGQENSRESK
jgi:tetratricopeptide (TPR) repeat protein